MAALFGSAILSICAGAQNNYYEACSKALDATSRQIGLRQEADSVEQRMRGIAEDNAKKYLGKESVATVAFVGFTYKSVKERQVTFKLPNLGLCNSVTSQVGTEQASLRMDWNF